MCSEILNFVSRIFLSIYIELILVWMSLPSHSIRIRIHDESFPPPIHLTLSRLQQASVIIFSSPKYCPFVFTSTSNKFVLTFYQFDRKWADESKDKANKTGTSNVIVTCLSEWVIVSIFAIFSEHFMIKRFGQIVAQDLSLRNLRQ